MTAQKLFRDAPETASNSSLARARPHIWDQRAPAWWAGLPCPFPQAAYLRKSGLDAAAFQKNRKFFTNTLAVFSRSA